MTDQRTQPAQAPTFRTTRMEAFSDGVFAIAITLLVLEIAVPAGSERDLWSAVLDEWPSYLAYLVSFSTVGAVWVGHTVITEFLVRATPVLIRLNLLLLMVVSFLPFPTKRLAEYVGEDRPERVAATIYGLNLLLTAVLLSVIWRYAVREGLIRSDIAGRIRRNDHARPLPAGSCSGWLLRHRGVQPDTDSRPPAPQSDRLTTEFDPPLR